MKDTKKRVIDVARIVPSHNLSGYAFNIAREGQYVPICKWNRKILPTKLKIQIKKGENKTTFLLAGYVNNKLVKLHNRWNSLFLPSQKSLIIRDKYLWFKIPTGRIGIYYLCGKTIFLSALPCKVILDELFSTGVGYYEGDGTRSNSIGVCYSVRIGSKDVENLRFELSFFESLGVPRNAWRFNFYGTKKELNKWCNYLGISTEQCAKQNNVRGNRSTFMELYYDNGIFRCIFDRLVQQATLLIETDVSLVPPYLKGVFAAEGSVCLRNKIPNSIMIHFNWKSEQDLSNFYLRCLSKIGVIGKKSLQRVSSGRIIVCGLRQIFKLYHFGILNLCNRKLKKFEKAASRIKFYIYFDNSNFVKKLFGGTGNPLRKLLITTLKISKHTVDSWAYKNHLHGMPLSIVFMLAKYSKVSLGEIKGHIAAVTLRGHPRWTISDSDKCMLSDIFKLCGGNCYGKI